MRRRMVGTASFIVSAAALVRQARSPTALVLSLAHRPAARMAPPWTAGAHISAATAAKIDKCLMSDEYGYSLEQLMELAGQAVAAAVHDVATRQEAGGGMAAFDRRVVFACGPGNNGGDGLVAARHLALLGFTNISVLCPKNRFPRLTTQLEAFRVPILNSIPDDTTIIVDCLFGFSFSGPPIRAPFDAIIGAINKDHADATLISVDVPSGWPVDDEPKFSAGAVRMPEALVSLTAPKACSLYLSPKSVHYCGGRFVPPRLAADLNFAIPPYCGTETISNLGSSP
jgi:NAD(P)H-hydrate epimerase